MSKEFYYIEFDDKTIIKVLGVGGADDDAIIRQCVQSISDLAKDSGYVNLDIEDIKAVMGNADTAFMSIGEASGDNAPMTAISNALNSISSEEPISSARSIIVNFIGEPSHLNMMALHEATQSIVSHVHPEANILWGISVDETLGETIRAVVLAANFESME